MTHEDPKGRILKDEKGLLYFKAYDVEPQVIVEEPTKVESQVIVEEPTKVESQVIVEEPTKLKSKKLFGK